MKSHYAVDAKRLRRSNTVIINNNNNNNDNREFHTLLYPDDVLNKKQSTVLCIFLRTQRARVPVRVASLHSPSWAPHRTLWDAGRDD